GLLLRGAAGDGGDRAGRLRLVRRALRREGVAGGVGVFPRRGGAGPHLAAAQAGGRGGRQARGDGAMTVAARALILCSALVAALRWAAMGLSPGVEILFGLQLLHAITFAMGFMGC